MEGKDTIRNQRKSLCFSSPYANRLILPMQIYFVFSFLRRKKWSTLDNSSHISIDRRKKLQSQFQRDRIQLPHPGSGVLPGLITFNYGNVVTCYKQGCFMLPCKNQGGSHRKRGVKDFDLWLLTRLTTLHFVTIQPFQKKSACLVLSYQTSSTYFFC